MQDADFMRLALAAAREGLTRGQSPFGALVAREGELLVAAHNVVWEEVDPTAHAEVTAIRAACRKIGSVHLRGGTIYSTTEPCPMCFSAIHWAGIARIVYAASIPDALAAGFNELTISNQDMRRLGGAKVEIVAGFMRDEALELFRAFAAQEHRKVY